MLSYLSEILEVSIQLPITFVKAANVRFTATSIPIDKSCDITSSLERLNSPLVVFIGYNFVPVR